MATFVFEALTPEQALTVGPSDTVQAQAGSAKTTTVLFQADGTVSVTIGAKTLVFQADFARNNNRIVYPDGTRLVIGDPGPDELNLNLNQTPLSGAIYGGTGGDLLTTGRGDWLVQGNQGDDRIFLAPGTHTIYGGQDNDSISVFPGGAVYGPMFAQGNRGDDTIEASANNDTLLGGQGGDRIVGAGGVDFINGNLGNDNLTGSGLLFGEDGDDRFMAGQHAATTVRAGEGNDRIDVAPNAVDRMLVFGDGGNDVINGSTITFLEVYGGDGADSIQITQDGSFNAPNRPLTLDGGEGNDTIVARLGDDTIDGGGGEDSLSGGGGANLIRGGAGNDVVTGVAPAPGRNTLDGGDGNDNLSGGSETDSLLGGLGDDSITDAGGNDNLLDGGEGNDRFSLNVGTHNVLGGLGNDTVDAVGSLRVSVGGGDGADSLRGSRNADTINGDAGNDTIDGAGGIDRLTGGAGGDTFVFTTTAGASLFDPSNIPRILDWTGGDDRLRFTLPLGDLVYNEASAADYLTARNHASAFLQNPNVLVVAMQVQSDVILFSKSTNPGGPDLAVILVGRTLNDISSADIL